jgi:hypothetical protein
VGVSVHVVFGAVRQRAFVLPRAALTLWHGKGTVQVDRLDNLVGERYENHDMVFLGDGFYDPPFCWCFSCAKQLLVSAW